MEAKAKNCPDCGHIMWSVNLLSHGTFWHCISCHQTVDDEKNRYHWHRPKPEVRRGLTKERKYRGQEPCPRCGEPVWVIEVPNFGSRQQCEDCRISIVEGAVLEWRSAPRA